MHHRHTVPILHPRPPARHAEMARLVLWPAPLPAGYSTPFSHAAPDTRPPERFWIQCRRRLQPKWRRRSQGCLSHPTELAIRQTCMDYWPVKAAQPHLPSSHHTPWGAFTSLDWEHGTWGAAASRSLAAILLHLRMSTDYRSLGLPRKIKGRPSRPPSAPRQPSKSRDRL